MRIRIGAASAIGTNAGRKLSPVVLVPYAGKSFKRRPAASAPFCSCTYVSIEHTCPDSCSFKNNGCYAQTGFTKFGGALLNKRGRAGKLRDADQPMLDEAAAIDKLFVRGVPQDGGRDGKSGRDLRLHVGGDVTSEWGARILARAAECWQARGGGTVWTYTHRWREVPRDAWGPISVLASVETAEDASAAMKAGYSPAWTRRSPTIHDGSPLAWRRRLNGSSVKMVPCPFESRGTTCVQCRLCLDRDLVKLGLGIAFSFHGPGNKKRLEVVT